MAVTGTTGDDVVTLTTGQANETVDLLAGKDTLNLPDVPTSLVVSNTETIIGGTDADQVTITAPPTGTIDLAGGSDTLFISGTAADFTSTTLTGIETLKAGKSSATTFTVDTADVASVAVFGSSGNDTLTAGGTALDLSSTALTSIEILKAGKSSATNFIVDTGDLASGGSVIGSSGSDTFLVQGTAVDLTSTTLSSIEKIQAGLTSATTFTVDTADVANATLLGNSGNDSLTSGSTAVDLTSTTLSGVEMLQAGKSSATNFTVDTADVANAAVIGSSGNDTLTSGGTALDLTSSMLISVEILKAGKSSATNFTIDADDLSAGGSVVGSSGNDTLLVQDTAADLSSTTLSSVEVLKAGSTAATTFTVDSGDLAKSGSVIGSSGSDTLVAAGTALDLSSTALSSVETLAAGASTATTFTVDTADVTGRTVLGSSGSDTVAAANTALDLTSTTLTSVEILKSGSAGATTFTVNTADLAAGGSVVGSSGKDTLAVASTAVDLTGTTLSSVEILKSTATTATTFTVDLADLASGGSVLGGAGSDTLSLAGTSVSLGGTTLSSVETIAAGTTSDTTFTVDTGDIAGATVKGSSGTDTLTGAGTSIDLSSTTLSSIEILSAGVSAATTFTIDTADVANAAVLGSTGNDTVAAGGTALDLTSTTLISVEIIKAGKSTATNFAINADDLSSGGSVIGSSGTDTLLVQSTDVDLTSTTLSNVEVLKAGNVAATTFTVNTADLAKGGSILGSSGSDTLIGTGTALDLSSTTLSSVEALMVDTTNATTFTVDTADIVSATVLGSGKNDTLVAGGTALDLTSATLNSIEILKAGKSSATSFTISAADLAAVGSVLGSTGADTLQVRSTDIDLTNTSLSGVEVLTAGNSTATTFTVDVADLAKGGSVLGSSGADTLLVQGTAVDLGSTALSSVEKIEASTASATTFTLDASDVTGVSIVGSSGSDTILVSGTALDLTSAVLDDIELLKAGSASATTFTLDATDFADGELQVTGSSGKDTLVLASTAFDVTSATLSSIEILKAGSTAGTTFTVTAEDLASGGSVIGGAGSDTLFIKGTSIDLSGTTLVSVENVMFEDGVPITIEVSQGALAAGGVLKGGTGSDTLLIDGTSIDLSSTTLSSVETLAAGKSTATTFTVDTADIAKAEVLGSSGNDTIAAGGTALDLTSTTLSSVEIVKAGKSVATSFTVADDVLASLGTVAGSSGVDTLQVQGTDIDLTGTALDSVDVLKVGSTAATTFTVDAADIAKSGSILGNSSSDTLIASGTSLNLSGTALSSVEKIQAGSAADTILTVDTDDVKGASVLGSSGSDTLTSGGAALDLTSTSLSSIETLKAGSSAATTFTVDAGDLATSGSVIGSTGKDTLVLTSSAFDLTSATLSSVEILKAGSTAATTFTVDIEDLASGGSVIGGTGSDTLVVKGTIANLGGTTLSSIENVTLQSAEDVTFEVSQGALSPGVTLSGAGGSDTLLVKGTSIDLTSTTLSSFETIEAGVSTATVFTVNTADVTGASILGSSGNDTLTAGATTLDLTSTTLSSVEILKSGKNATSFTVDAADMTSGGSVIGSTGSDTLQVQGTGIDLSSTTLTSVEVLKAGGTDATTFKVDTADLAKAGSILGNSGGDTLTASGTALNLSSTTLSSVETIQAGSATATTFTVDTADIANAIVIGGAGNDALAAGGSALNVTSTVLDSVEFLKAGTSSATTFTVDASQLAQGLQVSGSGGKDTLTLTGTAFDLTSATLSSVEILKAGTSGDTTFTVDAADLASGGSIIGGSGSDTLIIKGTGVDLTATSLVSIENVVLEVPTAITFEIKQGALVAGGKFSGGDANDTLLVKGSSVDLTSTTLSSVEILKAGTSNATGFTVNQDDLAAGGSVLGSTGKDTLTVKSTGVDLTGTTLSSIEILKAGTASATTFTVDAADLVSGGSVLGSTAVDTLVVQGSAIDLSSAALSSIEKIQAASDAGDTTFTLDQNDLGKNGSIAGGDGFDTLAVAGGKIDLSSTALSSIESLTTATSTATTFTVDTNDLAGGLPISGGAGVDTLQFRGGEFDLRSTTVSSVEVLKTAIASATVFEVDADDLAAGGSVLGSSGTDVLEVVGAAVDLTSTTLSSVEILRASSTNDTVFTVDASDLGKNGSVVGSSGSDTLMAAGTTLDLRSTTLSSVETIQAGSTSGTTFLVDTTDVKGVTVLGGAGSDTLAAGGATLDLTSTTLDSVEFVKAGTLNATTFIVRAEDLANGLQVSGSTGKDTLTLATTDYDLTSAALSSIEILRAGTSTATTFTVDAGDLASGGSVIGSSGTDTLLVLGASVDLSSTTISSVEIIQAATADGTTFTVNANDLAKSGSVLGGDGQDILLSASSGLDLSSTTLSGIEILKTGISAVTAFTVNQDDLADGGSVYGSSANDSLIVKDTSFDLTSTSLSSVEILRAGNANATTFAVDIEDLAKNGSVLGSTATDTLVIQGSAVDLSSTALTSVEIIKATSEDSVTFNLDQNDLGKGGSLLGSDGGDILQSAGSSIDLSSTALSSIETLQAGLSTATTFMVDTADVAGASVLGSSGNDTLAAGGVSLDLTSTSLSSVEILKAGKASVTTIKVDVEDLAAGGSVLGSTGVDTLQIVGATVDLTSTTLSSVEILRASGTDDTVFTVDASDLGKSGSVIGSSGADTLVAAGTTLDLRSTGLSSIETIQAGSTSGTTFLVDTADVKGVAVLGGTGSDTLAAGGTTLDLTSTTLDSVEFLKAGSASSTTFIVKAEDLANGLQVSGSSGKDTLTLATTDYDLTSLSLSSIEILRAGISTATTFTVDSNDLASGGSVIGNAGVDTLLVLGTAVDLNSTALSSLEIIQASTAEGTTFTVNANDLAKGGSVLGGDGEDTLVSASSSLDLSSTTLSGIEILKAGVSSATTFTVSQDDLVEGGFVYGSSGSDTLKLAGTQIDLTATTLSSIETILASNSATTFVIDADGKSVTIAGGTAADTYQFVDGYALDDLTSDTAILADIAILSKFSVSSTEIIDVAALVANGEATFRSQTLTQADVKAASPATLSEALSAAAKAIDGSTDTVVTSFQYGGATYVLVDNSGTAGLTTGDAVIKLSGNLTLTASEFTLQ